MQFDLYLGIDYSGAGTSTSRLKGLQVYVADPVHEPEQWLSPGSTAEKHTAWSREAIAGLLVELALSERRFIAGLDHCFSFPLSYFRRYALSSWETFLQDFVRHWPLQKPGVSVEDVLADPPGRMGQAGALRLTERWTQAAKSVFRFQGPGTVGKASFAGLAWLQCIRAQVGERIHVWPFDGWDLPQEKSVLVEVYPAICKRRYPRQERPPDEQDAFAVAAWLRDMDVRDALGRYSRPPLTAEEQLVAELEGWIFGVG